MIKVVNNQTWAKGIVNCANCFSNHVVRLDCNIGGTPEGRYCLLNSKGERIYSDLSFDNEGNIWYHDTNLVVIKVLLDWEPEAIKARIELEKIAGNIY